MTPVSEAVRETVEDLTDAGTTGFRSSIVARRTGVPNGQVQKALLELVESGRLELRFDLICPDNARTIQSFTTADRLPLGQTMTSDRCDSDEPFLVTEDLIWVVFVPTSTFRGEVRRDRTTEASGKKKPVARTTRPNASSQGLTECRTTGTRDSSKSGTPR